ncbi:ribonucleoside-diphosphate reductase [Sediminicola sp. YIK13]|uniref:adenosylcobalamin-dependent ribonucleoside-diphosphate reductase n=1 Tax=Sediminicola sp. YIK13 TaxID=1453352 RepID=UPI00072242B0|nr:adenosylcobalamin-dependent ribonucleoside-diphosphate reductase [Sediminicola sp. YIK13]ALM07776.1 ribonucleoside-diphosphate reductase [Sediminicola sp. YIK13]
MPPKIAHNAQILLEERYLQKNGPGASIETPDQLFRRVARHIASVEDKNKDHWEDCFYDHMTKMEFLPNSPTLMNAGLPKGQLSACFVLPINDSLDEIFTTLKNAALIHQSGGGTGYNFSRIRPKNDTISTTGGKSSGPIAFMKVFDAATEHVKQGGKRRGANMGILNMDHPDIAQFVVAKLDGSSLQNFNISAGITDHFMEAMINTEKWELINPRTGQPERTIEAKELWNSLINAAWKTGDPGLIFLDTINGHNPLLQQGRIQSTNPCGEVPLFDYESCNLGSINLSKILGLGSKESTIDWDKLKLLVQMGIRFLDNVIQSNCYVLPEVAEMALKNRKIGLGVMGWAELLLQLEIPYASKEAIQLAEKLMRFIQETSFNASCDIAKEKGCFPAWVDSVHYPNLPLRNATCNSIAPTGSISIIANTSYSIEPLYALAFKRTGILGTKTQQVLHPIVKNKLTQLGHWNNDIKDQILETGSIREIESIPDHIKKLFETSLEIPWKYHLEHQRAFQKYTDNAVSKTINLPSSASISDISEIYITAWKYGLKGITIYRDGSKANQVLQKCGAIEPLSC